MNTDERLRAIEYQLIKALHPDNVTVTDDSAKHKGHPAEDAGHFSVAIISPAFEGKTLPERHRMVYDAVSELMNSEIHALSIQAKTPSEV